MLSTKHASLLLIPKTMKQYGPFRSLWVGGPRGEGGLRPVKAELSRLQGNWQLNAHRKIMQKKALSVLTNLTDDFDEHCNQPIFGDRVTRFYSYRLSESASQAKQVVSGGVEPISVIQIKNRVFGIPISNKIMLRLVCVGWHKDLFGMAYFKWCTDDILDEYTHEQMTRNCCFLSLLQQDRYGSDLVDGESIYSVITSDWMDMQSDKSFQRIKIPGVKY